MKRLNILLIILCFISLVQAQRIELNNIKSVNLNSIHEMKDNDEIKGYYSLINMGKADRLILSHLIILDANLKQTHRISIKKPKSAIYLDGAFNGSHFCFTYIDKKKKVLVSDIYDIDGKKTGSYTVDKLGSMARSMLLQKAELETAYYSGTLRGVGKAGFIITYPLKKSGLNAALLMFDNTGHKIWEIDSKKSKKSYDMYSFFYASKDYIVVSEISRPKLMSRKTNETIIIIEAKTGKTTGKINAQTPNSFLIVNGVDFDKNSNEFFIYGEKVGAKKNKINFKDKKGLFIYKLTTSGEIINDKVVSWDKIFRKVKGPDKKKLEEGIQVMIHHIVRTDKGRYIAIGEQYNKEISAVGVATNVLGARGMSMAKLVLYNMMCFDFNAEFELEKVDIIEKKYVNVFLPSGYGTINESKLGFMHKVLGNFEYDYTTINSTKSNFSSSYSYYNKKKKRKDSKYVIGVITTDEDKNIINIKYRLKSNPTSFVSLPSTPGYITIAEFFSKEKKVVFRKEKLDI